ncbi:Protein CBG27111 [Caenorhabditis briggsae]|uniref:Protein CBG27111 n=1 Tax=Caenorhabditis briggsae TaxID=6238 RepID=B6IHI6_CAEBR|nr:Protein CBG27111 [Caenorhabditis briggsae]CAR99366.1 Protein CBG27111 [Caenorhabditis briggsae]
MARLNYFH